MNNMKNKILTIVVAVLAMSTVTLGQSNKKSVEVLYFKANLACCKAKACDALQKDVENAVKNYSTKENIDFKVVKLADEANKDLVAKYTAKSQTVVIVKKKGKKETSTDVSDIVQEYAKTKNKDKFENDMNAKMNEIL
jgi:hypothetical protein